jgi:hypothetical protein
LFYDEGRRSKKQKAMSNLKSQKSKVKGKKRFPLWILPARRHSEQRIARSEQLLLKKATHKLWYALLAVCRFRYAK